MKKPLTFNEDVKQLNIKKKKDLKRINEEYLEELERLHVKHERSAKDIASIDDLIAMVHLVLENCENGTKSIRRFAIENAKLEQWKEDVAKSRPKKGLVIALNSLKEHEVMQRMKINETYCEKDIVNNTLTGALKKLYKQVSLSNKIDYLQKEIELLKENLAAKENGEDWIPIAQKLRDDGWSLAKIGTRVGKSKAAVAKYTRKSGY